MVLPCARSVADPHTLVIPIQGAFAQLMGLLCVCCCPAVSWALMPAAQQHPHLSAAGCSSKAPAFSLGLPCCHITHVPPLQPVSLLEGQVRWRQWCAPFLSPSHKLKHDDVTRLLWSCLSITPHASPAVQAVDKDDSDGRAIQQHGRPVRQPAKAADEAAAGAGSSGSGVASAQSSLTQACGKLCSCACAARGTAGAAAGLEEGVGAERSWSGAAVPLLGSISEGLQPQVNSEKPQIGNAATSWQCCRL